MASHIDTIQLTSFVKQNTIQYSTTKYVEEYKCKTTTAYSIIHNFKKGEKYAQSVGRLTITGNITNAPTPPPKTEWRLLEATLTECVGGDNSILRLEFEAKENDDTQTIYVRDVSLSWKPYSESIFGFCANENHTDKNVNQEPAPQNQKCVAEHIKAYVSNPYKQQLSGNIMAYTRDGSTVYQLNPRESVLAQKINKGVEYAYYHKPVLNVVEESKSLSTDWRSDIPFDNIAEKIDSITQLPYNVIPLVPPIWKQSGTWKWVNIQDNVQCIFDDKEKKENHIWRRTRQYEGSIDPDINLYGTEGVGQLSGRWTIGEM